MEKLRMKSVDAAEGNVAKIAALFPQCVTERLNKDGKPELAIDFDKLRAELSKDVLDEGEERYQFTWPDKRAASRLANEPTDKTLRPCVEDSVDFWNTENLYIEGDNLDVLKVLRENYLGKVKMIYIDPPYNTGNDFVYNDDFTQGRDEFEQNSGLFDEVGNQLLDPMQRNTEANGRFHTDWLNMIYSRLKVARELLSDDGAIFISMDDSELTNLHKVCDEIFGESNFITCFAWKRRSGANDAKNNVSSDHEYVLCYAKQDSIFSLYGTVKDFENYSNPDNDPRGAWARDNLTCGKTASQRPNLFYPIIDPLTGIEYQCNPDHVWRFEKSKMEELINVGKVIFPKDGNGLPSYKRHKAEVRSDRKPYSSLIDTRLNSVATKELRDLLKTQAFDYPKTSDLLYQLINQGTKLNKNSIILDFFSGSATTAHAVMKLNTEDGGKRKFIMVQLPEVTDEKSEARKAGYANICEIGKERIRRAGKKIIVEVRSEKGVVNSDDRLFKDENSSLPITNSSLPDVGFRVLKLDSSNMEDVFYTPENFEAKDIFTTVDNVKSDRTPLDLLFQVMPELNIELSAKIEEKEVNGKKVFFVDDDYLIATFDTDVNESTVTEIAKMKPQYFVMRDASAANDNVLDNFEQIFMLYSPDTVCRVI